MPPSEKDSAMLHALFAASTAALSAENSWSSMPWAEAPAPTQNYLFTPQEPSTLSLAVIAIGILGSYWGIRQLLRPRRQAENVPRSLAPTQRPHRDAA
jgi:hypothetical protein